jgi:RNA 3'-terminal phosphate cyclase
MKSGSGGIVGGDCVGERGKAAEVVGEEAANNLLLELESKAPVDRHLGDMLIPYMAVGEGRSEIFASEITMHTLTNIRVAEIVAGVKFEVEGELGKAGRVGVVGVGLRT